MKSFVRKNILILVVYYKYTSSGGLTLLVKFCVTSLLRRRLLSKVMCTCTYNSYNFQDDLVPIVHDWALSSNAYQPLRRSA